MQFDIEKQTLCGKTLSVGHSSSGSVNNLLDIVTRAVLQIAAAVWRHVGSTNSI